MNVRERNLRSLSASFSLDVGFFLTTTVELQQEMLQCKAASRHVGRVRKCEAQNEPNSTSHVLVGLVQKFNQQPSILHCPNLRSMEEFATRVVPTFPLKGHQTSEPV